MSQTFVTCYSRGNGRQNENCSFATHVEAKQSITKTRACILYTNVLYTWYTKLGDPRIRLRYHTHWLPPILIMKNWGVESGVLAPDTRNALWFTYAPGLG